MKGVEDGMGETKLVCGCGRMVGHAGWLLCLEKGLKVRGVPAAVPEAKPEPPVTEREKCGKPAASFIPRWGMSFACVLDKNHEGECQQGGTCFKHGPYIGQNCAHWPNCVAPSPELDEAIRKAHAAAELPANPLSPQEEPNNVTKFLSFACSQRCQKCKSREPIIVNSAGYYSHSEDGNHCNNHWLYKAYEVWADPINSPVAAPKVVDSSFPCKIRIDSKAGLRTSYMADSQEEADAILSDMEEGSTLVSISKVVDSKEEQEHPRADCEGCNKPDCPCNARDYEGKEAVAYGDGFISGREAGYRHCGSCEHPWDCHDGECKAYEKDGSICGCKKVVVDAVQ